HRLMLRMCKPRKPRKNEPKDAILWHESPEQIDRLSRYCRSDVETEIGADHALMPLQPFERKVWLLDQRINNRGVRTDLDFVTTAQAAIDRATARANARMAELTGGEVAAVTQLDRLKAWAKWTHGVEFPQVTKKREL